MTPTRLLIGQILITFAIMALGVWASTQWAAAMLADQPQLGAPWFTLAGVPLYRPWSLFGWWHVFSSSARTPRFCPVEDSARKIGPARAPRSVP